MAQPTAPDVKQDIVDIVNQAQFAGLWIEYGVIEWAYAAGPTASDFISLLSTRWHKVQIARGAPEGTGDSVSKYLSNRLMSQLSTHGLVRLLPQKMPGTGFWAGQNISWWNSVTGPAPTGITP